MTRPCSCCTRNGTVSLASNTTRARSPDTNVLTWTFGIETGPMTSTRWATRHSTGLSRNGVRSRGRPSTGTSQRPPSSDTGDGRSLRSPSTEARLFRVVQHHLVAASPDADGAALRVARERRAEAGEHVVDRRELALGPDHGGDLAPLGRGQDRDRRAGRRGESGSEGQEAHEGSGEEERVHSAVEALQQGQFKGTALAAARPCPLPRASRSRRLTPGAGPVVKLLRSSALCSSSGQTDPRWFPAWTKNVRRRMA